MRGNGKFLDLDPDGDYSHPRSRLMASVPHPGISSGPARPQPRQEKPSQLELFSPCTPARGFCMKLLTQVNEEIGLEGEKRLQPENSGSPGLFYHWKITSTTSSRKLQREVIIQKRGQR